MSPKGPSEAPEDTGGDPRVHMAAERTLLAWIRTGLAMMGFGFVVARFGLFLREVAIAHSLTPSPSHGLSLWLGVALVALGVAVNVAAALRYASTTRDIRAGRPYRHAALDMGAVTAFLLAFLGAAMAVYLLLFAR